MKTKPKKRLCIVVPTHWSVTVGGAQYQAKLITQAALASKDYEVFFLSAKVNVKEACDPDYSLQSISSTIGLHKVSFIFDSFQLIKKLQEIKPDVIYQRVGCTYTGVTSYYAKSHQCKMVWHIAHEWDVSPINLSPLKSLTMRYLEKKMLEYGIANATQIIAQTNDQKALLEQRYCRTASVIPNFHPEATESIDKSGFITITWIANLKPWKRPELFLKLVNDCKDYENVRFIMIGKAMETDSEFDALLSKTIKLDNFNYLGECTQEKVNETLAQSHIFINTSLYEGFPNTFVQAWLRRNVVVSYTVNPDQVLSQKKIGYCANSNYRNFKIQVIKLIEDKALRESMASHSFDHAQSNHSESNVNKILELLAS